ncbi:MAG: serine hydrolase [Bacteroidota bacterium]
MLRLLPLLLSIALCTCGRAQIDYFPPTTETDWASTDSGYDPDSVAAFYHFLEATQTKGFLLLQDGKIALEKYFGDFGQDSVWYWASAGKSLRAALIGIAARDGNLQLTDTTARYLGNGWTNLSPDREQAITVWHQLTMTSGLNELFFSCTTPNCLRYLAPAGTRWAYHNSPYSLTKEVLEEATGSSLNEYTRRKIAIPLGMQTGGWVAADFNTIYFSRVRDAARFGHLILAGGKWSGGQQLLDSVFLRTMLSPAQDINPAYGYLWWLNGQDDHMLPGDRTRFSGPIAPAAPADLVVAAGRNGQFISVVPSTGTVMVRFGEAATDDFAPLDYHNAIWERLNTLKTTTATTHRTTPPTLKSFPNPAGRFVYLQLPTGNHEFALVDEWGRRCRTGLTQGRIALSGLPGGVYTLRLRVAGEVFVSRFVKRVTD